MNSPRPISELTVADGEVLAYHPKARMFYLVHRDPFNNQAVLGRAMVDLSEYVTHWWPLPDTEGIE